MQTSCQNTNLHEDFPNDDIVIILEDCTEDNGDPVFLCLKVPGNSQSRENNASGKKKEKVYTDEITASHSCFTSRQKQGSVTDHCHLIVAVKRADMQAVSLSTLQSRQKQKMCMLTAYHTHRTSHLNAVCYLLS